MICFRYYKNYGLNCEHFRFKKVRNGYWQRVVPLFWFICWPIGDAILDIDSMFYKQSHNKGSEE